MHQVGFEPTPPERTELESVALDHSAIGATIMSHYDYHFIHSIQSFYYHCVLYSFNPNQYSVIILLERERIS